MKERERIGERVRKRERKSRDSERVRERERARERERREGVRQRAKEREGERERERSSRFVGLVRPHAGAADRRRAPAAPVPLPEFQGHSSPCAGAATRN